MRRTILMMAVLALPVVQPAIAQDLEITSTLGLNISSGTANGLTYAGTTVKGSVEAAIGGFTGEIWIGSLYQDPADKAEIELSLGYGGDITEATNWGVTYTRYFLNNSGDQGYDLALAFESALSDSVTATVETVYAPKSKELDTSIGFDFAVTDQVSLHALAGFNDGTNETYAEFGLDFALDNATTLSVLYEDGEQSAGALTLSISRDFTLLGG